MAKSQKIQCRLHPDDEYEYRALEYFNQAIEAGYSPRQIICDALVKSAGYEPSMFPDSDKKVTRSILEDTLAHFGHEMISQLRRLGFSPTQQTEHIQESESDEVLANNIAKAYLNRRNQRDKS